MPQAQLKLFDAPPSLPDGMRYRADLITPQQERALVGFIERLPLKPFEFAGGFRGNRRVLSFGWRYDYQAQRALAADPMPDELLALRSQVARFTGIPAQAFQQALVTEYAPGAGIGWHKDRSVFGDVAGISLLSSCIFRLRRRTAKSFERNTLVAEPRSVYLLRGPSRTEWQHSIPGVDALCYSITFRKLKR